MNLPGLLIEYLINGSVALFWIFHLPLGYVQGVQWIDLKDLGDDQKLLLIPIAYVLGMFIDFVAWIVTNPIKKYIRKDALKVITQEMSDKGKDFNPEHYNNFWEEKIEIEKHYPDLSKQLTSRSSRDRIARGTMINLIPVSILFWPYINFIGIILLVLSFFMWRRFEHYNRCLELRAAFSIRQERAVHEK